MLTIIKRLPKVKGVQQQVLVRCVCGKEYSIRQADAVRAKSCGCLRSQGSKGVNTKHGLREHDLYGTCRQVLQRCYNQDHESWSRYGGRGITVHLPWHDISEFITGVELELGKRPPDMTLDRSDNNGNYEPGNIKWSTRTEQNRNRRDNLLIEINGITKSPLEWAEESGVPRNTIVDRYKVQGLRGPKLLVSQRKKQQ